MTTMSVTRALAELKRLDDRISKATSDGTFVGVSVGKEAQQKVYNVSGTSVDQLKSKIQSSFDLLESLFKQRAAIKAAVVKSNATTTVKLGAVEVTVAEAIEMKRSVESKRNVLRNLQRQQTLAQSNVAQLNAKLEQDIDSNLKTIYGSDKSKVDASSYELIAKPQKALKEASLIDPVDIVAKIASMEEEISLVDTELDFTLSEVNAKTEISF
jgi:Mg2+ and Co2+ transporter CorA